MNRRNEYSDDKHRSGRSDQMAQRNRLEDQRAGATDQGEPQYDISDEDYAPIHFGADDDAIAPSRYDDGGIPDDQREHRRFAEMHHQLNRFGDGNDLSGRYVPDAFAAHGYGRGSSFPGMERYAPERASPPPRYGVRREPRFETGASYSRSYGAGSDGVRYRNERELNYRYPRDPAASLRTEDYGEGDDHFVGHAHDDGHAQASLYGSPLSDSDGGREVRFGFSGLGPKNYVRSDERIREDVSEKLADDPSIDASDISVEVRNGTVVLTGQVDGRDTKYRVEDLVDHCSGVQDIDNRLTLPGRRNPE